MINLVFWVEKTWEVHIHMRFSIRSKTFWYTFWYSALVNVELLYPLTTRTPCIARSFVTGPRRTWTIDPRIMSAPWVTFNLFHFVPKFIYCQALWNNLKQGETPWNWHICWHFGTFRGTLGSLNRPKEFIPYPSQTGEKQVFAPDSNTSLKRLQQHIPMKRFRE